MWVGSQNRRQQATDSKAAADSLPRREQRHGSGGEEEGNDGYLATGVTGQPGNSTRGTAAAEGAPAQPLPLLVPPTGTVARIAIRK